MPPLTDAQRHQLNRRTAILRAVDAFYADLETVEADPGYGWPHGGTHRVATPRPAAEPDRPAAPGLDGLALAQASTAQAFARLHDFVRWAAQADPMPPCEVVPVVDLLGHLAYHQPELVVGELTPRLPRRLPRGPAHRRPGRARDAAHLPGLAGLPDLPRTARRGRR